MNDARYNLKFVQKNLYEKGIDWKVLEDAIDAAEVLPMALDALTLNSACPYGQPYRVEHNCHRGNTYCTECWKQFLLNKRKEN